MPTQPRFGTAWIVCRLAWRDLRFARRRLMAAILAMAAGVAAMSSVQGVSARMRRMIAGDIRQWIGADVTVSFAEPLSEEEERVIEGLKGQGVRSTVVIDTHAMISSGQAPAVVPATLKLVDPATYPLYGEFILKPAGSLAMHLREGWVVVSENLLERLGTGTGGAIRMNGVTLQIAAVIVSEPDRFAGYPSPMLRVLMTPQDYERSGVGRMGATHRFQFRFRAAPALEAMELRRRLETAFPYADVTDYRDPEPAAIHSLDTSVTFLGLVAWMALVFGVTGMGLTAYLHVRSRMESIAVMKALGGASGRIASIYLVQIGGIGLVGSLAGWLIGRAFEEVLAATVMRLLGTGIGGVAANSAALQTIGAGVAAAILVPAGPLWMVTNIRPLALLRRDYQVRPVPWTLTAGAPLAGLGLLAMCLMKPSAVTAGFLLGVLVTLVLVAGMVRGGLRSAPACVWALSARVGRKGTWLRAMGYGARSLMRPATSAPQMGLAIAAGTFIMTASWVGQAALSEHVTASLPGPGADFFVIGATNSGLMEMKKFVDSHSAAEPPMEVLPLVWMRLARVNGNEVLKETPRMWFSTCLDSQPEPLEKGRWVRAGQTPAEVVISSMAANTMRAAIDSLLEFNVRGAKLTARVVGIRRLDRVMDSSYAVTFACDAFGNLRQVYHGGVRALAGREEHLLRDVMREFPAAAIVRRAEFRGMVYTAAGRAMDAVRFLAALVLITGVLLLMVLIGATRAYRAREIATWKMLGADGRWMAAEMAGEFGTLGAVSGFAGGVSGCVFASLLVSVLLAKAVVEFSVLAVVAAALGGALLSIAAGGISTRRMRSARPLAILREE
ncbi:MAG: hypothetical protein JNL98_25960 [Bryobacterales bacterium]|nr:hypothetical protein [Bryobacterales bacterium]